MSSAFFSVLSIRSGILVVGGFTLFNEIKIFDKIGKYDPQKSAFKTWVTHITRNKCIDFLRWRKLQWVKDIISLEQVLAKQDVIVQDQPSPDETMTRKETKNEVWQALQSLPSKYREVVLLRDYFEYTWRDIAFILNCAIGTAHYRHQRAYEKLESILGENYSSDFGEEYE